MNMYPFTGYAVIKDVTVAPFPKYLLMRFYGKPHVALGLDDEASTTHDINDLIRAAHGGLWCGQQELVTKPMSAPSAQTTFYRHTSAAIIIGNRPPNTDDVLSQCVYSWVQR